MEVSGAYINNILQAIGKRRKEGLYHIVASYKNHTRNPRVSLIDEQFFDEITAAFWKAVGRKKNMQLRLLYLIIKVFSCNQPKKINSTTYPQDTRLGGCKPNIETKLKSLPEI